MHNLRPSGRGCYSPTPVINVTPLIDVLLVLLIIFMVIQPQKEAKLSVKAPAHSQTDAPAPPEMLMLTVSNDMHLELNSKRIAFEQLMPVLAGLMAGRAADARTLFVRAPASFNYETVVLLIDLAKGAGVVTVGLTKEDV
jgi:biopolymer transport protein ExbD